MSTVAKGRMGRPPKRPEERLEGRLIAKVTKEEEEAAKRRAEMLATPGGTFTVSSYVRMLVQQDLKAHGLLTAPASDDLPTT